MIAPSGKGHADFSQRGLYLCRQRPTLPHTFAVQFNRLATNRANFHCLPQGITMLDDSNLDQLASACEGLRGCGLGPTAAGKSLFAVTPSCAIPWDEEIRTEFALGENGSG
jgi:hypothetical protein